MCPPGYPIEALQSRVKVGTEAWLVEQHEYWEAKGLVNLLKVKGVYY